MPKNKVLVAGASGLVGYAAVRHFASLPDWDVVAVSRRAPERRQQQVIYEASQKVLRVGILGDG